METPTDTQINAPLETLGPVEQRYQRAMDQLVPIIPELHEKREAIDTASKEIVEIFDIQPEFFDNQGRVIVFAAISERWTHLKNETEDQGNEGERAFLHDCISLLARDFSPRLAEAKVSIDDEYSHGISEEARLGVYDKYTDKKLSKEITEKIKGGELLADIRKRMGITSDNEDNYEVRVLTAASDIYDTFGLSKTPLDLSLLEQEREEKHKLLKKASLEPSEVEKINKDITDINERILREIEEDTNLSHALGQQKDGLVARGKRMGEELGGDGLVGLAWVTREAGKTLLCISMPLAEKLTSPELTKHTSSYSDEDYQRDVATLEHEYVHTQGGLNIDHDVFFGVNLEELKAEHFSGNKQGYQDIKGFFVDYQTITGENPRDMFDALLKGGTPEEIYSSIAKRVGLSRMLEVVMASPNNYIADQSNEFSKKTLEYLDGYDGVHDRLIEEEIAAGRGNKLNERIEKRAKVLYDIIDKDSGLDWIWGAKRKHGLNVVTNLVIKRAEELGLKQAA